MKKYFLKNIDEMHKLASNYAKQVLAGEIYTLSGDLGAGKTTFTQGILKSLKAKGPFTSPTFNIVNHYKLDKAANGNIKNIYHIDAYRISDSDVDSIGLNEMINDSSGLILIEWAEKIENSLPNYKKNISFLWDEKGRFVELP